MLQSLHQREKHERTLWRLRPLLPLSPPGLVVYVGVHNFAMSRPPFPEAMDIMRADSEQFHAVYLSLA